MQLGGIEFGHMTIMLIILGLLLLYQMQQKEGFWYPFWRRMYPWWRRRWFMRPYRRHYRWGWPYWGNRYYNYAYPYYSYY